MRYRTLDIVVPFPPGSGDIQVVNQRGDVLKEFPYVTSDRVVMAWIDNHLKVEAGKQEGK